MSSEASRRLRATRCFHHAEREAVARCISCGRHYCRECVAEHDGRMTCAACLRSGAKPAPAARSWFPAVARTLQLVAAIVTTWLFFETAGRVLLEAPAPVHDGTFWFDRKSGGETKDEP